MNLYVAVGSNTNRVLIATTDETAIRAYEDNPAAIIYTIPGVHEGVVTGYGQPPMEGYPELRD